MSVSVQSAAQPTFSELQACRNCGRSSSAETVYRGALVLRDGKLAEKLSRNYKGKTVKT
jgi:hypothetical protein